MNHTIVCSEQNVFFQIESSNTVLMKGSTKTTWKINQSKLMETLEISVFITHVKFCSWFNLEGNFYSKMHFSLLFFFACLFFLLLGVWDCFVIGLFGKKTEAFYKLIKESDVCPSFCIYLLIYFTQKNYCRGVFNLLWITDEESFTFKSLVRRILKIFLLLYGTHMAILIKLSLLLSIKQPNWIE